MCIFQHEVRITDNSYGSHNRRQSEQRVFYWNPYFSKQNQSVLCT